MTDQWRDRTRATSFGQQAATYEKGRPDYPLEAVAWLLGDAVAVADVGAGTGKLTRAIARLGREVIAVEPDDAMIEQFRRALPGLTAVGGTGEHLPLPDRSLDAVTYGQSWHWVDPEAGSTEAARVLKPGGVLGLIWNVRDNEVPWVQELTGIMGVAAAERMAALPQPPFAAPFTRAETRTWRWTRAMTRQELLDMVNSRSPIITASDADRAAILAAVERLIDRERDGADTLDLPYLTQAWRLTR